MFPVQVAVSDSANMKCRSEISVNSNGRPRLSFTSSQLSPSDITLNFREMERVEREGSATRITDSLRFHQLRKQSDLVLIRSVQEDTFHHKYFTKPPLHYVTCFFLDPALELDYRRTAWKANYSMSGDCDADPTLASSSFNAYIDILLSAIVMVVVSLACLVSYGPSLALASVCGVAGLYYLALVLVCCKQVLFPGPPDSAFSSLYNWCRSWYPSQVTSSKLSVSIVKHSLQVFGAFLLALPIISLYSNLTFENLDIEDDSKRNFFMNLLVICLIHFCNFTQVKKNEPGL